MGHTSRAHTSRSNPLWCSYTNNTDTRLFARQGFSQLSPPSWAGMFGSLTNLLSHLHGLFVFRVDRQEERNQESNRQTERERERDKDDEIISLGMRFAPEGLNVLRL